MVVVVLCIFMIHIIGASLNKPHLVRTMSALSVYIYIDNHTYVIL